MAASSTAVGETTASTSALEGLEVQANRRSSRRSAHASCGRGRTGRIGAVRALLHALRAADPASREEAGGGWCSPDAVMAAVAGLWPHLALPKERQLRQLLADAAEPGHSGHGPAVQYEELLADHEESGGDQSAFAELLRKAHAAEPRDFMRALHTLLRARDGTTARDSALVTAATVRGVILLVGAILVVILVHVAHSAYSVHRAPIAVVRRASTRGKVSSTPQGPALCASLEELWLPLPLDVWAEGLRFAWPPLAERWLQWLGPAGRCNPGKHVSQL